MLLFFTINPAWAQTTSYVHEAGTTWVYKDTIIPSDPSSFRTASYIGEQDVTMYDRDANGGQGNFITVPAYVYRVQYDDVTSSELRVRKADFTRSRADELAKRYGNMMGQLPAILRQGVDEINILQSDQLFGGNASLNSIEITIGAMSEEYERVGNIEETLLHESIHAALDDYYGSEWSNAQQADKQFISKYAHDYPAREDIAETFLVFIALAQEQSRLTEAQQAQAANSIPNRLAFFANLNPNLYPVRAQVERAIEPRQAGLIPMFNSDSYYRLTSVYVGDGQSLDVINDGVNRDVTLTSTGDYSGQHWKITALLNGFYRLTTAFTGEEVSLGVVSADGSVVRLEDTSNVSGQFWMIESIGDGFFRLTTNLQGEDRSLGIMLVNGRERPILVDTSDISRQYWKITRIK